MSRASHSQPLSRAARVALQRPTQPAADASSLPLGTFSEPHFHHQPAHFPCAAVVFQWGLHPPRLQTLLPASLLHRARLRLDHEYALLTLTIHPLSSRARTSDFTSARVSAAVEVESRADGASLASPLTAMTARSLPDFITGATPSTLTFSAGPDRLSLALRAPGPGASPWLSYSGVNLLSSPAHYVVAPDLFAALQTSGGQCELLRVDLLPSDPAHASGSPARLS